MCFIWQSGSTHSLAEYYCWSSMGRQERDVVTDSSASLFLLGIYLDLLAGSKPQPKGVAEQLRRATLP